MIKVYLYGSLAENIPGDYHEVDAEYLPHIVSYFEANYGGFRRKLADMSVVVFRGDPELMDTIDPAHANYSIRCDEIHIMPEVYGRGMGGGGDSGGGPNIMKAILGLALIGGALFMSGGTFAGLAFGNGLGIGLSWTNVAMLGAALVLSAFAMQPKTNDEEKQKQSSMYRGPLQTQEQGGPVPVVYGNKVRVGIVVVATSLVIEDLPANFNSDVKDDPVIIQVGS